MSTDDGCIVSACMRVRWYVYVVLREKADGWV